MNIVTAVLDLLKEIGHDLSRHSDGGRKVTAAEWIAIAEKLAKATSMVMQQIGE